MVLGDADRPLLHRDLDVVRADPSLLVQALLAPAAAEHERAGIDRIGQQRVHRAIARPSPPHAAGADRSAWELLILGEQFAHDLPRGPEPPP